MQTHASSRQQQAVDDTRKPDKRPADGRQSNFELLRIIAMLMIIGYHLSHHGILHNTDGNVADLSTYLGGRPANKAFATLLLPGGGVGVALFFMITGYFMIGKSTPGKVHKLIYQGLFYAILDLMIFAAAILTGFRYQYSTITSVASDAVHAILAPYGCWWFFETYLLLCLLIPVITHYFNQMNKRGQLVLLFALWLLGYLTSKAFDDSLANLFRGVLFFAIGGYVRKNVSIGNFRGGRRLTCVLLFTAAWVVDSIALCTIYSLEDFLLGSSSAKLTLLVKALRAANYGVLTPLCAVSLFILFTTFSMKSNLVNTVATTTFGIYLFHDNSVTREIIWIATLHVDTWQYGSSFFILTALGSIAAVFVVGALIDMFRQKFFTPLAERNWSALTRWREKNAAQNAE